MGNVQTCAVCSGLSEAPRLFSYSRIELLTPGGRVEEGERTEPQDAFYQADSRLLSEQENRRVQRSPQSTKNTAKSKRLFFLNHGNLRLASRGFHCCLNVYLTEEEASLDATP